jgi:hypothetical protein
MSGMKIDWFYDSDHEFKAVSAPEIAAAACRLAVKAERWGLPSIESADSGDILFLGQLAGMAAEGASGVRIREIGGAIAGGLLLAQSNCLECMKFCVRSLASGWGEDAVRLFICSCGLPGALMQEAIGYKIILERKQGPTGPEGGWRSEILCEIMLSDQPAEVKLEVIERASGLILGRKKSIYTMIVESAAMIASGSHYGEIAERIGSFLSNDEADVLARALPRMWQYSQPVAREAGPGDIPMVFLERLDSVPAKCLVVGGDTDGKSGGVLFDGPVFVEGGVGAGGRVEAAGDVIVSGHVHSAVLKAGGSVTVLGSVSGGSRIEAGGGLAVRSMDGSSAVSGGDARIWGPVSGSSVFSGGDAYCGSSGCGVSSSAVFAKGNVYAAEIGAGSPSIAAAGVSTVHFAELSGLARGIYADLAGPGLEEFLEKTVPGAADGAGTGSEGPCIAAEAVYRGSVLWIGGMNAGPIRDNFMNICFSIGDGELRMSDCGRDDLFITFGRAKPRKKDVQT